MAEICPAWTGVPDARLITPQRSIRHLRLALVIHPSVVVTLASLPTNVNSVIPPPADGLLLSKVERSLPYVNKLAGRKCIAIELDDFGTVDLEMVVENRVGTIFEGVEITTLNVKRLH